ncbi:MAG: hypothetical protein IJ129_06505 [Ruminococcus sp.]|nr:hypothetical protein [Ruminococcus sp.]
MSIKNSWKRVIAGTLAVLVVAGTVPANVGTGGLFGGTSITAYAVDHVHHFTYSADGATITATCSDNDCTLTDHKVTLTIVPNPVLYYNDGQPKEASLEGLEDFNAATGLNITTDDITYYKGDTNVTAQIKAGSGTSIKGATYTARLTVAGQRATVTFRLTAKPVEHTHSFSYAADGNVITATCTQNASNMEACNLTNKQATLTLNAPLHTTYGDGKNANATLTGEIPGVTNPTIHYSKGSVTLNSAPIDAGTYTAWCQLGNATASVEYTIARGINPGWTTIPKAVENLVYTGSPQKLVIAGTASTGNILYTVGLDPQNEPDTDAGGRPYTSSVPEMTDVGKYYVWCKIDGGKNYTSIAAQKIEVNIGKAAINPSVSIVGWTYGATPNTPVVSDTDNPGNGDVTYTYKVKGADDSTYTSDVPTAAGEYTVKAVIAETSNYKGAEATSDFTIAKAIPTVTVPTLDAVNYDPSKTLADITLPTGWAWVTDTIVPSVINSGYDAALVVDDANYDYTDVEGYDSQSHKVTRTLTLTVNPYKKIEISVFDGSSADLLTGFGFTVFEDNGDDPTPVYNGSADSGMLKAELHPGEYTALVYADNYVARSISFSVDNDGTVSCDEDQLRLHKIGDYNGDGKITYRDILVSVQVANGNKKEENDYLYEVLDVQQQEGGAKVDYKDVMKLIQAANGKIDL